MDDGSTDGTGDLARELIAQRPSGEVKLVRVGRNQGKGASVRTGVQLSRGHLILMVRKFYLFMYVRCYATAIYRHNPFTFILFILFM